MTQTAAATGSGMTRVRWLILAMLFAVTTINYADRATLSIAGSALSKSLGLDPVTMGYAFSAFGWSYVIAQLPGGWLLDRFGSKKVYFFSIFTWSLFTILQGGISFLTATVGTAIVVLFSLRLLVGLAEAPSFPANGRIVAAWFPAKERGTASAIFNSAQYFATVLFSPIMGWVTHAYGWPAVFYLMGAIGVIASLVWLRVVDNPATHPKANKAEIDYIEAGGGLVRMDQEAHTQSGTFIDQTPKWSYVKQLLGNRMLLGIYIMALSFFGKGLGALGWAVVSDTSPKEIAGLSGAVFNTFGGVAAITTPIIIGYLVKGTGSFSAALVFVAANALVTVICYLFVVGKIQRVELNKGSR